jgi:hypothetical protein
MSRDGRFVVIDGVAGLPYQCLQADQRIEWASESVPTQRIAETMYVSRETVEAFRTRIKAKLGLNNST